ncbi:response regulator transcription factor [Microbacterium aurantiacum]|uniref:response regulator transcription factor n=1 Tax=Microbacterium aurantiacum TaxID=162393 RepID=UPI001F21B665|nr:response regulator transcription factor [Microbacterium aurantiacum]
MNDSSGVPKTAVIVEDDAEIRHLLVEVFEGAGFSTVSVGNGIDGVQAVISYQPTVTTLDINMPGIDGFEAARRIRQQSDTYIIMLTGLKEEADLVLGLGAGADEYLTKPFRPRELRARLDAILRRRETAQSAGAGTTAAPAPRQEQVGPSFPGGRHPVSRHGDTDAVPPPPSGASATMVIAESGGEVPASPASDGALEHVGSTAVRHRDLVLDPDSRIVLIDDREVDLTRTEFDLLATLMESKRRVRTKADLTLVLRGESYVTSYFVGEADKRAIEAHMTNLRRKLGDSPTNPRYIETVRGVGYRLTAEAGSPA